PGRVEGVASLVGRAELLVAAGMLGAVLCARRGLWLGAIGCAVLAMLSKEHGVVIGVVILLDDWLQGRTARRYPIWFYCCIAAVTIGYLAVWYQVGRQAAGDVAVPFIDATTGQRLAVAFPAVLRAARLLVWPLDLSADYNPQVIPAPADLSLPGLGGALVVCVFLWIVRR